MQTWKIITISALAIVLVALLTASAYAYMGRTAVAGNYATNTGVAGNYAYPNGMMGGYGYAYNFPPASGYTASTTIPPSTTSTATPVYPYYYGGMGCGGIRGLTGYPAPR